MTHPDIVQSALGDEGVAARVDLGDDGVLVGTVAVDPVGEHVRDVVGGVGTVLPDLLGERDHALLVVAAGLPDGRCHTHR